METKLSFLVAEDDRGERLDRYLAAKAADLSRARIKQLIDRNFCRVDGESSKAGQKLKIGQFVELTVPPDTPLEMAPDSAVLFDILYQDASIIVGGQTARSGRSSGGRTRKWDPCPRTAGRL